MIYKHMDIIALILLLILVIIVPSNWEKDTMMEESYAYPIKYESNNESLLKLGKEVAYDGLTRDELVDKLNKNLYDTLANTGSYFADYLLIGKSSGGYEFVFVELEHPNGRTTLISGHEGEAFRKGTYQIYDWKAEIEAHFSASFATIIKYSNKPLLPKEFTEYDSSRFHYVVVAGLREDYNEATYRDRRNKEAQQNILTLHYDNLYDKACELETAQSF